MQLRAVAVTPSRLPARLGPELRAGDALGVPCVELAAYGREPLVAGHERLRACARPRGRAGEAERKLTGGERFGLSATLPSGSQQKQFGELVAGARHDRDRRARTPRRSGFLALLREGFAARIARGARRSRSGRRCARRRGPRRVEELTQRGHRDPVVRPDVDPSEQDDLAHVGHPPVASHTERRVAQPVTSVGADTGWRMIVFSRSGGPGRGSPM